MNENLKKIEHFIRHFEALEVINLNAQKDMGAADKELSDWYHRAEGSVITHVSQSHNLIKEVQSILKRRRELKIETITLRSTCDTLRATMVKVKETHASNLKQNKKVLQEIKDNANGK